MFSAVLFIHYYCFCSRQVCFFSLLTDFSTERARGPRVHFFNCSHMCHDPIKLMLFTRMNVCECVSPSAYVCSAQHTHNMSEMTKQIIIARYAYLLKTIETDLCIAWIYWFGCTRSFGLGFVSRRRNAAAHISDCYK